MATRRRGTPTAVAALAAWTLLAAVPGAGCSGDLFHDTSFADRAPSGGSCPGDVSPIDAPCVIDESRGVFVRLEGRPGAAGTREDPYGSLEEAVAAGRGMVFACAQTFVGPVVLPGGTWLVGGLACDEPGWPLSGDDHTHIDAPADVVPLRLVDGSGAARLERLTVAAADATAPGGSSIALLSDGVDLVLRDCDLSAGAGADGLDGAAGDDAEVGDAGAVGDDACGAGAPGAGGSSVCEATGGDGGEGSTSGGGNPGDGDDGASDRGGAGGAAQPVGVGWTCTEEGRGSDGTEGLAGADGVTAPSLGSLLPEGFVPASGGAGEPGLSGGAGGGGGATRGVGTCRGAGGGGGGAGGCGGAGGRGGGGGGGSFAIVALRALVVVEGGRLAVGDGGAGGVGGTGGTGADGAPGGAGGAGDAGEEVAAGCRGGDGARGGDGGSGAGGPGGHTVAIAFDGPTPTITADVTLVRPGAAGPGGAPAGGSDGEHGADGVAADTLALPPPSP